MNLLRPFGYLRHIQYLATAVVGALTSVASIRGAEPVIEKLLGGLQLPCSIAVQSAGNSASNILIADRGAGRVLKVTPGNAVAGDIITGFPVNASSADQPTAPGIQSILFLDSTQLVAVGGGSDGKPFVHLYELPDSGAAIRFGKQKQSAQPTAEKSPAADALRSFHDLVRTRSNERVADALFVAGESEHGPLGLWKTIVRANTIGEITPLDAGHDSGSPAAPSSMAISTPGYVAVAARATNQAAHQSTLKFLSPADGRLLLEIRTDLANIAGLAYSPSSGNLYAANVVANDSSKDGIYRIEDAGTPGRPGCKTRKVASFVRPTALAFGSDGTLYVTALGPLNNSNRTSGALYKVSGDF